MTATMKTAHQVLDEIKNLMASCPLGRSLDGNFIWSRDITPGNVMDWLQQLHEVVAHSEVAPAADPEFPIRWERRPIGPSPRYQQMAFRLRELDSVLQAEGVQIEPKTPLYDQQNNLGVPLMPATIEALSHLYPGAPYQLHPIQLVSKLLRECANVVAESRSINATLHNHLDDWLGRAQNIVKDETEFASLKLTLFCPIEHDGIEHFNIQVEEQSTVKDIAAVRQHRPES